MLGKALLSTAIGATGGFGYSLLMVAKPVCASCNPVAPVLIGGVLGLLAAVSSR